MYLNLNIRERICIRMSVNGFEFECSWKDLNLNDKTNKIQQNKDFLISTHHVINLLVFVENDLHVFASKPTGFSVEICCELSQCNQKPPMSGATLASVRYHSNRKEDDRAHSENDSEDSDARRQTVGTDTFEVLDKATSYDNIRRTMSVRKMMASGHLNIILDKSWLSVHSLTATTLIEGLKRVVPQGDMLLTSQLNAPTMHNVLHVQSLAWYSNEKLYQCVGLQQYEFGHAMTVNSL